MTQDNIDKWGGFFFVGLYCLPFLLAFLKLLVINPMFRFFHVEQQDETE